MTKSVAESNSSVSAQSKAKMAVNRREAGHVPDFEEIESSAGFRELMKQKKSFLISTTALFLGLYLLFIFIISYTEWLSASFIGDISWVWVFAFSLFAMTWILVTVYMKRAAKFDEMARNTLIEFDYDEEENR